MTENQPLSQAELTELEIGAFMGPHIKRARIALVLMGILYAVTAYLAYGDVSRARDMMHAMGNTSAEAARVKHLVDMAYYFVVFTGVAGIASIVLAAIAGTKTTFAMYAAVAIFAAHTLFQLYLGGVGFLLSWEWWLIAIVVGMGFQAAWKADQLRKERAPAQATALSL
ncbi:MAG TPA: hypothetical protein VIV40_23125 [Kofleriaceae bacterium]